MTSDSKIQHDPENEGSTPDVDDTESVFGDDAFPDTPPNSSDGSTKVMTNQALEDMGLQVPSWRTDEPCQETFANPEDESST
ncbi:MAG: hypothetical protein KDA66_19770, partial [Planctomycetaceae bacterium]|nr:hypothetical protein [Planctomycetaceae bacterium]